MTRPQSTPALTTRTGQPGLASSEQCIECSEAAPAGVAAERFPIQTLRGLACLLIVAFHVIDHEGPTGLRVPADSPYHALTALFAHLRLPLFTFLSGFVYAYRPIDPNHAARFLFKKARRLLIPLLVVSTVFLVLKMINPGTHEKMAAMEVWRVYLYPFDHLWFLQALFLLFLLTAALDLGRQLSSLRSFAVVFGLILGLHLALELRDDLFFSAGGALFLAPFFLAGIGANRYRQQLMTKPMQAVFIGAFALAMGTYVVVWHLEYARVPHGRLLATLIGLTGCMALLSLMPRVRVLAWIGSFSFAIYLYHVIFNALVRHGLDAAHVAGVHLYVVLAIAIGLAGPITLELLVRRWAVLRLLVLGQGAAYRPRFDGFDHAVIERPPVRPS